MVTLTKENYYDSPRLSNSALNWILPETGGSVEKYLYKTLFPVQEEESEYMRLGTLIHKFVEHGYNAEVNEIFEVAEIPSPAIAKIIQEVHKNPSADLRSEVLRVARMLDYQSGWKDETVINKVLAEGSSYLEKLKLETEGKTLVTQEEMNQLSVICTKLEGVIPWNFKKEGFLYEVNMTPVHYEPTDDVEILNEHPIAFEYKGIECKALIDILLINHTRKKISIIDLKTTSTPIHMYQGYNTIIVDENNVICSSKVEGVMYKRNVHRQLAFYKKAVTYAYPEYDIRTISVLAVETNQPYDMCMVHIPDTYLTVGSIRIDTAIEQLKHYEIHEKENDL